MNQLPLMIFGCFPSRDSQLHNTCSFCSIKVIYISKIPPFVWRIMFRNPQERAVTTTQTEIPNSILNVHRNMSNVFIINPQVVFKIYKISNIYTATVFFSRRGRDNGCPNSVALTKRCWHPAIK